MCITCAWLVWLLQFEAAKTALAEAERAKAAASAQVDEAAGIITKEWEHKADEDEDSSGQRRHLAEKEKVTHFPPPSFSHMRARTGVPALLCKARP
jgi:hypothetical protein